MFDSNTVLAPAKINLGLKVYPKREDGFHNIQSIFTTVPLFDELKVSLIEECNVCYVKCDEMQLPANNTITQAYKAFCVLTGEKKGVNVELKKRIPAGGGLGGGSSDSSSFLKSIDTLLGTNLSESELLKISGEVGSDVFFFTKALCSGYNPNGGMYTAIVEGRGEKIETIQSRDDLNILLVFPGVEVSTKIAYSLVDDYYSLNSAKIDLIHSNLDLLQEWKRDVKEMGFVNDFTAPVIEKYGLIGKALEDIKTSGADFADMSGSGATLYGIYSNRVKATVAAEILSKKWKTVLI